VFTARYELSPYITQIRFIFKGLIYDSSNVKIMKHNFIVKNEILFYQTQFCTFLFVCFIKR
jgi:hypothetical protein